MSTLDDVIGVVENVLEQHGFVPPLAVLELERNYSVYHPDLSSDQAKDLAEMEMLQAIKMGAEAVVMVFQAKAQVEGGGLRDVVIVTSQDEDSTQSIIGLIDGVEIDKWLSLPIGLDGRFSHLFDKHLYLYRRQWP